MNIIKDESFIFDKERDTDNERSEREFIIRMNVIIFIK